MLLFKIYISYITKLNHILIQIHSNKFLFIRLHHLVLIEIIKNTCCKYKYSSILAIGEIIK